MRLEKDGNRAAQVAPADPMTRRLFDETTQTDCVYRGCRRHIDLKSDALKAAATAQSTMDVLMSDVGATHVKILGSGAKVRRLFEPGPSK